MSQQAEPSLTHPDMTEQVADFYDRYPYPRPADSLDQYHQIWKEEGKRRSDYYLFWLFRPFREDYAILVAGCGTSQAAKHALRWPKAEVTGIDISATSVRSTEEFKRKYNLTNLQMHQLSVERLGELEMTFDQIVCTGVLHHLVDPDAGLAALRRALKPDGAMNLMVYAPYGRTGIYMLQEFCKRIGISAADEEIGDLLTALRLLPAGHPLRTLVLQAPDFRHESGLADALLHPQDRAYSVPQFFDFLKMGGMTFHRWVKQAPYSVECGVMACIPQASRLKRLSAPDQYAAAELFRGTMLRHSAVVYRSDRPCTSMPIGFNEDAWLQYVPLRMSNTISIYERLPVGAAAVLINKSHIYTDLFLPVSAAEKLMYDAIDGALNIDEIVRRTLPS